MKKNMDLLTKVTEVAMMATSKEFGDVRSKMAEWIGIQACTKPMIAEEDRAALITVADTALRTGGFSNQLPPKVALMLEIWPERKEIPCCGWPECGS